MKRRGVTSNSRYRSGDAGPRGKGSTCVWSFIMTSFREDQMLIAGVFALPCYSPVTLRTAGLSSSCRNPEPFTKMQIPHPVSPLSFVVWSRTRFMSLGLPNLSMTVFCNNKCSAEMSLTSKACHSGRGGNLTDPFPKLGVGNRCNKI